MSMPQQNMFIIATAIVSRAGSGAGTVGSGVIRGDIGGQMIPQKFIWRSNMVFYRPPRISWREIFSGTQVS